MNINITNNLKRPEPQALAGALEALAARFGNRLITSQAVREQHAHTTTWLAPQPPDAVVMAQETAGYPGRGADLRQAWRAGDRLRHRHLAGGPGQRAGRRRLHRSARHEQGAGSPCRGPRLRDPARRHPQGAERASARPGRCSSRSIRAPTPRSAAWPRPGRPAPTRCATAPCATTCWRSRSCAATARSSRPARGRRNPRPATT